MREQVKPLFSRLSKYAIGDGDANSIDNSTRSGIRATTNGRGVAPLTLGEVILLLEDQFPLPRLGTLSHAGKGTTRALS
ncbi:hypothetical protein V6N12_022530 [Hibiscus sabdariffa]|uniref:Uncharacterized protein n=1 Tax=Hibiscus sabdariffa TaxID=183260 RepID=A0ABR2FVT3_9ROSI